MGRDTLLLGTRKGFVVYRRKGDSWESGGIHHKGIPVSIATADSRNGRWWAMLDHGHWGTKLSYSDDRGSSWNEVEAPVIPEGEEIHAGVPASTRLLWAFAEGGAKYPDRIWIGTEPGALFKSEDNGQRFELVRGLWDHPSRLEQWQGGGRDYPAIHSILVDPNNSDRIKVAISCAGVFESEDSGKTWTVRNKGMQADFLPDPNAEIGQDPHIVVACGSDHEMLWQQNHCGIYRSKDGGKEWLDVSQEGGPANFGFVIAVDEQNPDRAWVVPAESDGMRVAIDYKLCVCRTEDGGASWQTFRNGLPQQDAFDIVFRHAMDNTGEELVFGTTTGNLYRSTDGGENWQAMSHNLPMIHSVQFV